jgi:hypothetical protein
MTKVIQFGEYVEGYSIPVLNEREVRASAGILFFFILISLMQIIFENNFLMVKYAVTFFLLDLLIRVFINPRFSPSLIIGRFFVRNQNPEYVGAAQKKFAWYIGIAIASLMFFLMVILNSYSEISGIGCMVCLIFLFFESAFGICVGCKIYNLYYGEKAQYCPGEVCEVKTKQNIQRISKTQIVIFITFILIIVVSVILLNDILKSNPNSLWDMTN